MNNAIAEMINATELEKQKPAAFLAAWKQGIKLAGEEYFNIAGGLDSATDKNQLAPNYAVIESGLHCMSRGQATFLAAMYSFYNGDEGQLFLEQLGRPNMSDIAAGLDKERAEVISALFLNYAGW